MDSQLPFLRAVFSHDMSGTSQSTSASSNIQVKLRAIKKYKVLTSKQEDRNWVNATICPMSRRKWLCMLVCVYTWTPSISPSLKPSLTVSKKKKKRSSTLGTRWWKRWAPCLQGGQCRVVCVLPCLKPWFNTAYSRQRYSLRRRLKPRKSARMEWALGRRSKSGSVEIWPVRWETRRLCLSS